MQIKLKACTSQSDTGMTAAAIYCQAFFKNRKDQERFNCRLLKNQILLLRNEANSGKHQAVPLAQTKPVHVSRQYAINRSERRCLKPIHVPIDGARLCFLNTLNTVCSLKNIWSYYNTLQQQSGKIFFLIISRCSMLRNISLNIQFLQS